MRIIQWAKFVYTILNQDGDVIKGGNFKTLEQDIVEFL